MNKTVEVFGSLQKACSNFGGGRIISVSILTSVCLVPSYSDPTHALTSAVANAPLRSLRPSAGSILVLVAGVIALGVLGFAYYELHAATAADQAVTQDISTTDQQLATMNDTITQLDQYQVLSKNLTAVFGNQKDWSAILETIQQHLYKHIIVSGLQIDDTGKMTISGTTPTFTDYAKLYASLTSPDVQQYFSNVKPTSLSRNSGGDNQPSTVSFSFTMDLTSQTLSSSPSPLVPTQ